MFDDHLTDLAPLAHREPLAYSITPRTVPTLVTRFTSPRPLAERDTPNERRILVLP